MDITDRPAKVRQGEELKTKAKSAHDISREYRILSALHPVFAITGKLSTTRGSTRQTSTIR